MYDVLGFNDGRVCGNVSSYIFRSKSNVALVRFVSNSVGKWPGFNLTFSHVERIESKYSLSISIRICLFMYYKYRNQAIFTQ